MRAIDLGEIKYIGADIVKELILKNQQHIASTSQSPSGKLLHEFLILDLVLDPLPKVDLVFCRDCLIHLPNEDIVLAIKNIKRSGSKYLLVSSQPDVNSNVNIIRGSCRAVDLCAPPFSFPEPLCWIADLQPGEKALRQIGLWIIADMFH